MRRALMLSIVPCVLATCCGAAQRTTYTRNVAIVIYENAEPLDWSGPFEVYNDAANIGAANGVDAFNVYIVSKTTDPVDCQGMKVVPAYSMHNAPKPDIVLFPGGPAANIHADPEFFAWASKAAREAEIAQSVCTGAFVLGKAGLLDNLEVTTHYGSIDRLQQSYPKAQVKRGRRFIDNGRVVTTAGISAGIDGSLHVVARLLGRRVADEVARYMEYHWSPEASLAMQYSYFNPSTDESGRRAQAGDIQFEEKNYTAAEATFRAIVHDAPGNRGAWSNLAWTLNARGAHAEAAEAFVRAIDGTHDGHTGHGYYLAAAQYARARRADDAVAMLRKAFDAGFTDRDAVAKDPDFAGVKNDPRVKQIVAAR